MEIVDSDRTGDFLIAIESANLLRDCVLVPGHPGPPVVLGCNVLVQRYLLSRRIVEVLPVGSTLDTVAIPEQATSLEFG